MRAVVVVNDKGVVTLPEWAWRGLLKMSGVRSKRRRIQKKAIKRTLIKILTETRNK